MKKSFCVFSSSLVIRNNGKKSCSSQQSVTQDEMRYWHNILWLILLKEIINIRWKYVFLWWCFSFLCQWRKMIINEWWKFKLRLFICPIFNQFIENFNFWSSIPSCNDKLTPPTYICTVSNGSISIILAPPIDLKKSIK